MFEGLHQTQKLMIFEGLMLLLKSPSNLGFKNDKGGMAYVLGAKDGAFDQEAWGDSPDTNKLYLMMVELSEDLRGHRELNEFVNCWQDFCRIATEAHKKHRDSK